MSKHVRPVNRPTETRANVGSVGREVERPEAWRAKAHADLGDALSNAKMLVRSASLTDSNKLRRQALSKLSEAHGLAVLVGTKDVVKAVVALIDLVGKAYDAKEARMKA